MSDPPVSPMPRKGSGTSTPMSGLASPPHPYQSYHTPSGVGSISPERTSSPTLSSGGRPGSRLRHRVHHVTDYSTHTDCENSVPTLTNLMVANRGEIAIRVFRTAHELGLHTTAVFAFEDRMNMHRYKADEAYQIGYEGQYTPVGAYLAMDEIIDIAKKRGVDVIHPGYGFLSENAEFARKVEAAGIKWVGPSPQSIERMGDKTSARHLAMEAGVPIVPGSDALKTIDEIRAFIKEHGLPVILKAAMGGGGRGMRVVRKEEELASSFERAQSEALSAFGDGTIFVERFLDRPKHIEVQLLGDGKGDVIHLFERDCSVQRRHQKVVEMAPAHNLPVHVRDAILADAVKIAKHVNYRNAGTAEFLVDQQHRHYFIEVNPRIQVEHTVTEEITGIDIVAMQIRIAGGATLRDLGLSQDKIVIRGNAIQCRVTTEDPDHAFAPDTGRIELYRSVGGNGIRLDGANVYSGAVITPYYDSLLVKVTCLGASFDIARRKVLRALAEFRLRGVKTNIPFLHRLVNHQSFIDGQTWTTFIDDTPSLFAMVPSKNRVQKMLTYLAEVIVNGSPHKGQTGQPGQVAVNIPTLNGIAPDVSNEPCGEGWRSIFLRDGPAAFAKAVRAHKGCLIMDTTWRDAHQSLLATRVRTKDLVNIATTTSWALKNAWALECWGGATFDVSMRFLYECPWDRLRQLRALCPQVPFQMLLRGANAVGYTSYPDNVIYAFCAKAKEEGIDIFRVFDSLNYMENMTLGIDAVLKAGGICEGCICYTGDVSDPTRTKYNLEYYLDLVAQLVKCGIHILGIKDMAGLLKPKAATMLIGAIRAKYPDLPIHVHTHDTAGTGVASMIAAAEAGADAVDAAVDSMSGFTSQPSMGALVASLAGTPLDTGIAIQHVQALSAYWSQMRILYGCFDANVRSTSSDVYLHEMPGGQYTNLLFQASQLGLGTQWEAIKQAYAIANRLCGDIVKVTPSSKVVGDLAQFMVSNNLDEETLKAKAKTLSFPKSVVEYFQGYLGQPAGGFPEPLRSDIVRQLPRIEGRPGASMEAADLAGIKETLVQKYGKQNIKDVDVLSYVMYPGVFEEFRAALDKYGDLSVLPTRYFFGAAEREEELSVDLEEGKTLFIEYIAAAQVNTKTGSRDVIFQVNGESRRVSVLDQTAAVETSTRVKANPSQPGEIGAPMSGVVVDIRAQVGGRVAAGDPICVLSSMKMETVVTSPVAGLVDHVEVNIGDSLSQGDLCVRIIKK